jgi:hypothetical protein
MAIPSSVSFLGQLSTAIGATSAITSLISTRYYHSVLPQNVAFDALTYKIVGIDPSDTKDGASDFDALRVQFSCFSSTTAGAETLYAVVRTKFDRYTETGGAVEFHFTRYIGRQPIDRDIDTGVYVVTTDFSFTIK